MPETTLDEIGYFLTAAGHLPCPRDPVQAAYWGGWVLDMDQNGAAVITYAAGTLGPYDETIANSMAIGAYGRTLTARGYRVTPVPYPGARKYLEHYLEVRAPD